MNITIDSAQFIEAHWQVVATVETAQGTYRAPHIVEAPADADEATLRAAIVGMYPQDVAADAE